MGTDPFSRRAEAVKRKKNDLPPLSTPRATVSTEVYSPSLGRIRSELETGRGGNHREGAFAIIVGRRPETEGARSLNDITDFAEFVSGLL